MSTFNPHSTLGPHGAVAGRLPGYEVRREQLAMAEAVGRAIETKTHLMVEAGTGVGKSFAYLVPAILAAVEGGKKVVVSTRTINLQEQLMGQDLPFLSSVMPQTFQARLVKGRSNYISLRRMEAAMARSGSRGEGDDKELVSLKRWAARTTEGSLADLDPLPSDSTWEQVVSDSGNCLRNKCPRYQECFFFNAVRQAWKAQILVVNHALYMSDLALRSQGAPGILPDHDVAIFDEAHTLANQAAAHLGLRVASGAIANMINRLFNERTGKGLLVYHGLVETQQQAKRALQATDAFFDAVADWKAAQGSNSVRVHTSPGFPETIIEELRKFASAVGQGALSITSAEQRIELEAAQSWLSSTATNLESWLHQSAREKGVYWVEPATKKSVVLAYAPLDLGPILERDLFGRVSTCILTSATLSVGSPPDFGFSLSRLGRPKCATVHLGTPFDFDRQVTIYLAKGLPDPSSNSIDFERVAIRAIPHFVRKTGGKALVLFTSHQMMAQATRTLAPWFRSEGINLLSQTGGQARTKLLARFKTDVNSVLFGTDSFWQGVDVPGEALSSVIIPRLPFSGPGHPLLDARLKEIERAGGSPFLDYTLPEAVLKFKQGIGRLIRSKSDKGIVSILDPRVLTKPYGQTFLESLPKSPRIVESPELIELN